MISLKNLKLKHIERLITSNSPAILTAIGVVGVVGTALLTHKATTKANLIMLDDFERRVQDPDINERANKKETFELVWKCYIPPVVSGVATIACVVGANRIGSKRAAAVAAAYTLSEKAYSEYREQVVKKIGENEERKIRDEWAQERVNQNPPSDAVIVMGTGDVLCLDGFSGRYLRSSVNSLQKAVNDTNHEINSYGYSSLTDFYDRVGLSSTDSSSELGWNQDRLLEIEISGAVSPEGEPCIVFHFQPRPEPAFSRIHP